MSFKSYIMSVLDIDELMNKTDKVTERFAVLEMIKEHFVKIVTKSFLPVLLIDPDNEVDFEKLMDEIGDGVKYVDMIQYRSIPYRSFEQGIMLPFVNGNIKILLLDNIDCFPQ